MSIHPDAISNKMKNLRKRTGRQGKRRYRRSCSCKDLSSESVYLFLVKRSKSPRKHTHFVCFERLLVESKVVVVVEVVVDGGRTDEERRRGGANPLYMRSQSLSLLLTYLRPSWVSDYHCFGRAVFLKLLLLSFLAVYCYTAFCLALSRSRARIAIIH